MAVQEEEKIDAHEESLDGDKATMEPFKTIAPHIAPGGQGVRE